MTKPAGRTEQAAAPALSRVGRMALIAGSGALPVEAAARLAAAGHPPLVFLVEGEAEPKEFEGLATIDIRLEQIGRLVPTMRREGVTHLAMAGGISRRPALLRIEWSLGLLRFLPRVVAALARGDDGLLRALMAHIEDNGIEVLGVHEIVPDLLAPEGVLTRRRPGRRDEADIEAAFTAAAAIGRLDIGQAAISIGGGVVALEGIEGTDGLLERMAAMRGHGRLGGRKGGVLAKCAKPGQELRADLPAIGPGTVERAHAAGLSGIAVEADRAFVLDHGHAVERADALGLFIVGRRLEDKA